MGSEEAVAGLMDMRYGLDGGSYRRSPNPQMLQTRRIGNVSVSYDQINELFQQYVIIGRIRRYSTDTGSKLLYILPPFPIDT